jgi:acetate---CoA ligase (ADP-forming)
MLENISDIDPNFRVELAKSFESEALQISVDTGHAQIEDVLASLKISGKLRLSETERTTLVTQIQAIAAFAEQHGSCLVELDVNPIILDTAGRATAVDALLRLAQE